MNRKRRSFSPEFKQEAASLVLDQGYTIPQASVSLGVGESAVRRWVQQLTDRDIGPDTLIWVSDRLDEREHPEQLPLHTELPQHHENIRGPKSFH